MRRVGRLQIWIGLKKVASAASFTASDMVGWAWQVRARSSDEPPNSISTATSWIISPAPKPTMWRAEHAVGLLVGEDLDEAVGVQHGARAAVGGERELADLVVDAGLLQLLLGLADGGDFRLV